MLKVICDKCGADCDLTAYDVLIRSIHNPCPHHISDRAEPQITDEANYHIRFVLCSKCYRQFRLPNLYENSYGKNEIVWRGSDGEN